MRNIGYGLVGLLFTITIIIFAQPLMLFVLLCEQSAFDRRELMDNGKMVINSIKRVWKK